jgi:acyltransferase-like protein
LALVLLSPVVLAATAVADVILRLRGPGSWRTTRLAAFLLSYVALEVVGIVWMFVLWVASGFGARIRSERMQRAHFAFMRTWLGGINQVARKLFHLRVRIEDPPTPRSGPILVFSRHAGPGNSLLLVGTLLIGYKRRPRIVMLAKLQWEPLYDIMLNRLPNRFIRHDPKRRDLYLETIADLASDLGDDDAFVLFPEGKDFTPKVRMRAIDYLRNKGFGSHADRAEKMTHVLPPRHNGVMAAMRAAPEADIVFVAHSVLEDIGTFKQLWTRIPFDHPIAARYWRITPAEFPDGRDACIAWLFDWWERIDEWIAVHEGQHSRPTSGR